MSPRRRKAEDADVFAAMVQVMLRVGPSAYDIVFLCNFLTREDMTEQLDGELRGLACSLTPGGLVIVIGGTGSAKYQKLFSKVRDIAASARLRDVSPQAPFQANADSGYLPLVANHIRENVRFAIANSPSKVRSQVEKILPKELLNDQLRFALPKFQLAIFVRQEPSFKRRSRKRGR